MIMIFDCLCSSTRRNDSKQWLSILKTLKNNVYSLTNKTEEKRLMRFGEEISDLWIPSNGVENLTQNLQQIFCFILALRSPITPQQSSPLSRLTYLIPILRQETLIKTPDRRMGSRFAIRIEETLENVIDRASRHKEVVSSRLKLSETHHSRQTVDFIGIGGSRETARHFPPVGYTSVHLLVEDSWRTQRRTHAAHVAHVAHVIRDCLS